MVRSPTLRAVRSGSERGWTVCARPVRRCGPTRRAGSLRGNMSRRHIPRDILLPASTPKGSTRPDSSPTGSTRKSRSRTGTLALASPVPTTGSRVRRTASPPRLPRSRAAPIRVAPLLAPLVFPSPARRSQPGYHQGPPYPGATFPGGSAHHGNPGQGPADWTAQAHGQGGQQPDPHLAWGPEPQQQVSGRARDLGSTARPRSAGAADQVLPLVASALQLVASAPLPAASAGWAGQSSGSATARCRPSRPPPGKRPDRHRGRQRRHVSRDLRVLRANAGLDYPDMAEKSHYTMRTLASAEAARLPTLPVLIAYVQACNGDVSQWRIAGRGWPSPRGAVALPAADGDAASGPGAERATAAGHDPGVNDGRGGPGFNAPGNGPGPQDQQSSEVYVITSAKPRDAHW